jgi:hypothetical protein
MFGFFSEWEYLTNPTRAKTPAAMTNCSRRLDAIRPPITGRIRWCTYAATYMDAIENHLFRGNPT